MVFGEAGMAIPELEIAVLRTVIPVVERAIVPRSEDVAAARWQSE